MRSNTVKATVAAIILHPGDSGRILLARRGTPPYEGYWSLPGGHIDPYETSVTAVRREVREELALDFAPQVFRCFDEIIAEREIHAVVQAFAGEAASARFQVDGRELAEARWTPRSQLGGLDLAFRHAEVLSAYFEERDSWLSV